MLQIQHLRISIISQLQPRIILELAQEIDNKQAVLDYLKCPGMIIIAIPPTLTIEIIEVISSLNELFIKEFSLDQEDGGGSRNNNNSNFRPGVTCYICKEEGHFATACPQKGQGRGQAGGGGSYGGNSTGFGGGDGGNSTKPGGKKDYLRIFSKKISYMLCL